MLLKIKGRLGLMYVVHKADYKQNIPFDIC